MLILYCVKKINNFCIIAVPICKIIQNATHQIFMLPYESSEHFESLNERQEMFTTNI